MLPFVQVRTISRNRGTGPKLKMGVADEFDRGASHPVLESMDTVSRVVHLMPYREESVNDPSWREEIFKAFDYLLDEFKNGTDSFNTNVCHEKRRGSDLAGISENNVVSFDRDGKTANSDDEEWNPKSSSDESEVDVADCDSSSSVETDNEDDDTSMRKNGKSLHRGVGRPPGISKNSLNKENFGSLARKSTNRKSTKYMSSLVCVACGKRYDKKLELLNHLRSRTCIERLLAKGAKPDLERFDSMAKNLENDCSVVCVACGQHYGKKPELLEHLQSRTCLSSLIAKGTKPDMALFDVVKSSLQNDSHDTIIQCERCFKFFEPKSLGPHQRRCRKGIKRDKMKKKIIQQRNIHKSVAIVVDNSTVNKDSEAAAKNFKADNIHRLPRRENDQYHKNERLEEAVSAAVENEEAIKTSTKSEDIDDHAGVVVTALQSPDSRPNWQQMHAPEGGTCHQNHAANKTCWDSNGSKKMSEEPSNAVELISDRTKAVESDATNSPKMHSKETLDQRYTVTDESKQIDNQQNNSSVVSSGTTETLTLPKVIVHNGNRKSTHSAVTDFESRAMQLGQYWSSRCQAEIKKKRSRIDEIRSRLLNATKASKQPRLDATEVITDGLSDHERLGGNSECSEKVGESIDIAAVEVDEDEGTKAGHMSSASYRDLLQNDEFSMPKLQMLESRNAGKAS